MTNDVQTNDLLTSAIMSSGMKCLVEKLGIVEAEVFISHIKEPAFDYTEWRKENLWKDKPLNDILDLATEQEKLTPHGVE